MKSIIQSLSALVLLIAVSASPAVAQDCPASAAKTVAKTETCCAATSRAAIVASTPAKSACCQEGKAQPAAAKGECCADKKAKAAVVAAKPAKSECCSAT
ncbi:MAG: hypothetical protein P8R46_01675, partial [Planctomycetota bacterium]|nr:hypothetical protein [Planctomycetota bacterium]